MSAIEHARDEWEEGYRRYVEAIHDPVTSERLGEQFAFVTDELRRRVGATFSLNELADAYTEAESWARAVVEEQAPAPGWARTIVMVVDAAFYLYGRGALDYAP